MAQIIRWRIKTFQQCGDQGFDLIEHDVNNWCEEHEDTCEIKNIHFHTCPDHVGMIYTASVVYTIS